ncbi:hypothetical protein ACQKP5_06570 [Pseudomonas vancouverensis]|uniref:hypothetical protein n=1 Tax=Pseudomonas vancouverensis TaxID=95300 RepID=UPI003CFF706B
MPWYRAGTVSVTQNSATVIGSGTAFVANGRVGDAFRGPDGSWYEVSNIASDTAMSIIPAYQGASNASGAYALAPMQGYVKDSADALRGLVSSYGAKLAALGTTGNYETLPLSKGGTGATTVPAARANLGLGTASTANMQTNNADVTPGVALAPGAYGWGGVGMVATDANNAVITGLHRLNTPYTNGPTAAPYSMVVTRYDNEVTQLAFQEGTVNPAVFVRKRTGTATWGSWRGLALSGANSDITSISGLTTALSAAQGGTGVTSISALLSSLVGAGAYSKSNTVGVVSQASGVPTGSILEYGANANGTWIRFADGTQICWGYYVIGVTGFVPSGNVFYAGPFNGISFAKSFATAPICKFGVISSGGLCWMGEGSNYASVSATQPYFVMATGAAGQNCISYHISIGRWY